MKPIRSKILPTNSGARAKNPKKATKKYHQNYIMQHRLRSKQPQTSFRVEVGYEQLNKQIEQNSQR
jgi:hypothetical protein